MTTKMACEWNQYFTKTCIRKNTIVIKKDIFFYKKRKKEKITSI